MRRGARVLTALCVLASTPGWAGESRRDGANGFRLLNPDEAAEVRPTPVQPPPCTGRSHAGRETGTLLGGIAGLVAGSLLEDGGALQKLGAGAAGAGVAGTVGYLLGRWYDGPDTCSEPRLPDRPNVVFLSDDQLERLDHRLQTPQQATLPPREPTR